VVLGDKAGESIGPVVRNGRTPEGGGRPMPPLPLPESDLTAIAEYVHSVVRTAQPQGAPPPGAKAPLNLLVGNARRGERYVREHCAGCHSTAGDLAGIGARLTDIEQLQNSWVSGRRLGGAGAPPPAPRAKVKLTLADGQNVSGTLERLDDFVVGLRLADGTPRSYHRRGSQAQVTALDIDDPMAGHRRIWTQLKNRDMHVTAFLATLK
jgi:mono/diheme cytochrome c family protein